ncbi:hypothetical protein TSUD_400810 [Trifolium subterraneum]|uniref:TF-B3 domain-containing protein n=1 Tax=Trifolium subterraneum TaxID=3900 RepID=A0A2Z6NMA2_TRISU|nr:hypothetical protein TSUD_400810 [Trifolium subterraneum]
MAEPIARVLQRPTKGFFSTVHVIGEVEGEVEKTFYEDFKTELRNIWHLYDSKRNVHFIVEFNSDDDVPRITTGWVTIRDYYNFDGHHQIFFRYLGTNQFQIIPTEEPITPDLFPTWHTQSQALRKAVTFTINMAEDPESVPYLKLPQDMGEYLWNTGLDEIYIVGTIREQHKCELTYQMDPFEVTISRGWRKVAGINGFKVGDRLLFNTSNIYENHMFYVRSCN